MTPPSKLNLISYSFMVIVFICVIVVYFVFGVGPKNQAKTNELVIPTDLIRPTSTLAASIKPTDCSCEQTFKQSYPIVWNGKVIATFVSGQGIGVERYTKNDKYNVFYASLKEDYKEYPGKDVQVTGRLVGMTCAYANTVFGECVADVEADKVVKLN